MVIACWCQREETPDKPFTDKDRADLKFLYDEWAHPYFISIQEFERLMKVGGTVRFPLCLARSIHMAAGMLGCCAPVL